LNCLIYNFEVFAALFAFLSCEIDSVAFQASDRLWWATHSLDNFLKWKLSPLYYFHIRVRVLSCQKNMRRGGDAGISSPAKHQRTQSPQPLAELGNKGYMPVLAVLLAAPTSVFELTRLRNVCTATQRRFEEHLATLICPLSAGDREMLRWHNLTEPIELWSRASHLLLQPLDQASSFTQDELNLISSYQQRLLASARCGAIVVYTWLIVLANQRRPMVLHGAGLKHKLMIAEPRLARMPIMPQTALNPWDMIHATMVSDSDRILSSYLLLFFTSFRGALNSNNNIYKPMELPQRIAVRMAAMLPRLEEAANAAEPPGSPKLAPLTVLHQLDTMAPAICNAQTTTLPQFPVKVVTMMCRLESLRAQHRAERPPMYLIARRLVDGRIIKTPLLDSAPIPPNWNTPQRWWRLLAGFFVQDGSELQKIVMLLDDKCPVNPLTTGYPETSLFAAATKTSLLYPYCSFFEQFVLGSAVTVDELDQALQLYAAIENCTAIAPVDLLRLLTPYLVRTGNLAAVQSHIKPDMRFKTKDVRDFISTLEEMLKPQIAEHRAIVNWALKLRIGHANSKKPAAVLCVQSLSWRLNLLEYNTELDAAAKRSEISSIFENDDCQFWIDHSVPSLELYLRYNAPLRFLMAIFHRASKHRSLPPDTLTELRRDLRKRIRQVLAEDPNVWKEAVNFCVKNRFITAEGEAALLRLGH
jgi:hypothetical protein